MALATNDYTVNEHLQPGARGELFQSDIPGYRNQGDRMNRTNNYFNTCAHDVPNSKYMFDYRLPSLFRFGYGVGFNQVVIPKGRLVALDPHMDLGDFEMQKEHNTMTLANGGIAVRLRTADDKYPTFTEKKTAIVSSEAQGKTADHVGKGWAPISGFDKAYSSTYFRPFATAQATAEGKTTIDFVAPEDQLKAAGYEINTDTGLVMDSNAKKDIKNVRPGNKSIGVIARNEYTRDDDAFNGMMPGPVLTDALVEFPWFAFKDKAEQNPFGSVYGAVKPGDLVKSDENGRVVLSPLSSPKVVATMTLAEYELERQQVIGEVYEVNHELVPEGAAKWATWSLEDRLKSDEFNPAVYAKTNRHGEDAVNGTPFRSDGKYPGYSYDKNFLNHDLNMLASTGRLGVYDPRMNAEFQYDNLGIPALSDGHNVGAKQMPEFSAGFIHYAGGKKYVQMRFNNLDVNVEDLQFSINGEAYQPAVVDATACDGAFVVKYADAKQGIVMIDVADQAKADTLLKDKADGVEVKFSYKKRGVGLAGTPTWLDWDGIVGSCKILFQK